MAQIWQSDQMSHEGHTRCLAFDLFSMDPLWQSDEMNFGHRELRDQNGGKKAGISEDYDATL